MENRELIIPARFDCRDALAGLRTIEESGHAASDLGRVADAASARFRKAHESFEAASQEYLRLRRALRQAAGHEDQPTRVGPAADEPVRGAVVKSLPPEEWLESGEGLRATGAHPGGPGTRHADEQVRKFQQGSPPLLETGGPTSQQGVGRSDLLPDSAYRGTSAESGRPSAGVSAGPSEGWSGHDLRLCVTEGATNRGLGGEPGPSDGMARSGAVDDITTPLRQQGASSGDLGTFLERGELLAEVRRLQSPANGADDLDEKPGRSGRVGRVTRGAVDDYVEWMTGGRDGGRDGIAAARPGGPVAADGGAGAQQFDMPALRGGDEARHNGVVPRKSLDLREVIWKTRPSSPVAAAAEEWLSDGQMMRPIRGGGGTSSGERGFEARLGGTSIDVIERLLREQNELIRQDLQRNAHPPIAAPPPMRGGGIRM